MVMLHIVDRESGEAVVSLTPGALLTPDTAKRFAGLLAAELNVLAGTDLHYVGKPFNKTRAHNIGPKPRGKCPVCRGEYPLNKNGGMAAHGKTYGVRGFDTRCKGSHKRPAKGTQKQVA